MLPDAIQRRKRLEDKATWLGPKQVCRHYDESGIMTHDELSRDNDARDGVALLRPVMMAGIRTGSFPTLMEKRLTLSPTAREASSANNNSPKSTMVSRRSIHSTVTGHETFRCVQW
jgi:hypothetical protein